jgi:hypothetical protein
MNTISRILPFLSFTISLFLGSCESSVRQDSPKKEKQADVSGDRQLGSFGRIAEVPSINKQTFDQLGISIMDDPSTWKASASSNRPAAVNYGAKEDVKEWLINYAAAVVLHKKNLIHLPSPEEARELSESKTNKEILKKAFKNERTFFRNYAGKHYDLQQCNIWVLDEKNKTDQATVLTISPFEGRIYLTQAAKSNAYCLRTLIKEKK